MILHPQEQEVILKSAVIAFGNSLAAWHPSAHIIKRKAGKGYNPAFLKNIST